MWWWCQGILNRVVDEHAGLIPRAIGHVFGHVAQHPERDWEISMSFIQIYLETIQVCAYRRLQCVLRA